MKNEFVYIKTDCYAQKLQKEVVNERANHLFVAVANFPDIKKLQDSLGHTISELTQNITDQFGVIERLKEDFAVCLGQRDEAQNIMKYLKETVGILENKAVVLFR